ncbi:FAD/NAD(P)-binding domain-containing protein [Annulohypoxylon truncatum]|uniref:FAD/NAD(P)-binding domain-containing protein n=1 Tax=Annulohypoxylon truncatum TaxID=327061 RepID=UPI0020074968|nr:FAD/NAD(P)-binding domain-containing protein [Annulohypoxylon truncatum]KAI1213206.1 FAD/NAD(P)-binding domain-containing protein [Annulohypoxylon truncatum]
MKSITLGINLSLAASALAYRINAQCQNAQVITRDVAIVGGGATGTYAALNLKDEGKSFVIVERKSYLGGHTATYHDPTTGTPINYGLQVYWDNPNSRYFFNRLNISVSQGTFPSSKASLYIDFTDGTQLTNYSVPTIKQDYINELHKYPYIENGLELPDPVPEDLLLPWQEYMDKFNLTDDAYSTYSRPAATGDLTKTLALYVFNNLNTVMIEEEVDGKTIVNADGDYGEPYRVALNEFGDNVLLNSTVTSGTRGNTTSDGVTLCVSTPQGNKQIVAKQLIFAAPPVMENLGVFGLDQKEEAIFSKFAGGMFYTGVVTNIGLPANNSYVNRGASTDYHVYSVPGNVMFNPTKVEGTYYYWYTSLEPMTQQQVESATRDTLKLLQKSVKGSSTEAEPNFVAYNSHAPLHPTTDADSIRAGIYRDYYNIQGYRNTWYTGSLLVTGSPQLWNITAQLLPKIIAAA